MTNAVIALAILAALAYGFAWYVSNHRDDHHTPKGKK